MNRIDKLERLKGMQTARDKLELLHQKWPSAFPRKYVAVMPLAASVERDISAAMGWSLQYAKGVLSVWKRRAAYCDAVLRGGPRIDIDGNVTGEPITDRAREMARTARTRRVARLAAQRVRANEERVTRADVA
jgi:sRNA-binding protein